MCSWQIIAHKVFVLMAAREFFLNFVKIFGGVDSHNIWNTMVVVVCKIELICEKPKVT